ncbi:MAG TPA: MarR family transcriptional regulator [Amycolatopsis sp.]|uniref:MarR family winged helix-turn-helix transcriptional regulator n=1 Tax=Amycolatopsis sp. TaxID=37632 RepID=UPI002B45AF19|nr:MarR family transcriptional regulator [Amycolatopsis sp.]HKS50137.1 MarR family transcriptional regulator [Amycolatopsis sp.]
MTDPPASAGTEPNLAELLLRRLFEIADVMSSLTDYAARELGMSAARARLLWILRYGGTISMRELATRLEVTPRTITGLVDGLEADGWVRRGTHSTDRRVTLITLTPAAVTTLDTLERGYRQLAERVVMDLSEDETRTVVSALDRILDRLAAEAVIAAGPPVGAGKPPGRSPGRRLPTA